MAEENQDNTMEDILFSIKNILEEDEAKNSPETPLPEADVVDDLLNSSTEADDVLELSPDMRIEPSLSAPGMSSTLEDEISVDISLPSFNEEEKPSLTIGIEDETSDSVFDEAELSGEINLEAEMASTEDVADADQIINNIPVVDEYVFEPEAPVVDLPAADEAKFEPDISFEEIIEQDEPVVLDTVVTEPEDIELVKTFEEVIEEPVEQIETPLSVEPEILPETVEEPIVEPRVEPIAEEVVEIAVEPIAEQPKKEEVTADAVDVSAGIISNFAKMFAKEEPIAQPQSTEPAAEIVATGNLGKTLEEFVLEAITKVIGKEISRQWNNGAEFKSFAEAEINRQTREWLNDNLPTLVEKVVKQEIERVIAKVGS